MHYHRTRYHKVSCLPHFIAVTYRFVFFFFCQQHNFVIAQQISSLFLIQLIVFIFILVGIYLFKVICKVFNLHSYLLTLEIKLLCTYVILYRHQYKCELQDFSHLLASIVLNLLLL